MLIQWPYDPMGVGFPGMVRRMGERAQGTPSADVVRTRVLGLPKRFRSDAVDGLRAEWELRVGGQTFAVRVGDHACTVVEGPGLAPQTTIWVDPDTWFAIDEGRMTGPQAFLLDRLRLAGNLDLAVRLQTLFRPYRRARRLTDLDQVETVVDGIRISSYVVGRGRPVLLLHGLGGTKISWAPLLGPLAERHQVLVPDLPGHGESEKPRVEYSPRFYAQVVGGLLDELGIERAVVLGNSMGGRIALELALRSPKRVAALGLLDPALPGQRWRSVVAFTRLLPMEIGAVPFPIRERWMKVMVQRLFANPERLGPDAVDLATKEFMRVFGDPRARMAFLSSLRALVTEPRDAFWSAMRRVEQRTLVVVGEDDRLVPSRLGVRLAETLPNADLLLLPNVGHVPQFEATAEILEPIMAFLDSAARKRWPRSS